MDIRGINIKGMQELRCDSCWRDEAPYYQDSGARSSLYGIRGECCREEGDIELECKGCGRSASRRDVITDEFFCGRCACEWVDAAEEEAGEALRESRHTP